MYTSHLHDQACILRITAATGKWQSVISLGGDKIWFLEWCCHGIDIAFNGVRDVAHDDPRIAIRKAYSGIKIR
jgi:hypothetical protein